MLECGVDLSSGEYSPSTERAIVFTNLEDVVVAVPLEVPVADWEMTSLLKSSDSSTLNLILTVQMATSL